jgi:hypothetical protein
LRERVISFHVPYRVKARFVVEGGGGSKYLGRLVYFPACLGETIGR